MSRVKHPSTRILGITGERAAEAFLVSRGYSIVQRNLRLPGGEIDIVAIEGNVLVFIEVKLRRTGGFGPALRAVDARKRARLRGLAADYAQIVAPTARFRFDVVAIDGNRLALHRNAF